MRRLTIFAMLGICGACGASAPETHPATHDDFRAIQRHEATIDARLPEARAADSDCDEASAAATQVCDAAGGICRIADETADLDAIDRCEAARDACRSAEEASTTTCAGP